MIFNDMQYERPDFDALLAAYDELIACADSAKNAEEGAKILNRHNSLMIPVGQMLSLASIRHSINTTNEFYLAEEEYYAQNSPILDEKISVFYAAILKWSFIPELQPQFTKVFFTNAEMETKTISPSVISLMEKENLLCMDYDKLQGSAQIEFEGNTLNLAQLGAFKDNACRETRQKAYTAEAGFYDAHRTEFEQIFDNLVKTRTEIAHALGFKSFTELGYLRMTRNCYSAEDVEIFRGEIAKTIVPIVAEMKKQQALRIDVADFKFYDDALIKLGGNPKPHGSQDDTYRAGVEMYKEMNADTREFITKMDEMKLFDLKAMPGKMTGGYCAQLAEYKMPFIFANFNGSSHDVDVFTHEGGHAFAGYIASKTAPLLECTAPTLEGCEVHSMSMEFLCWKFLEKFYGDDANSARAVHLTSALYFLPYGCMVDEFQHIVYANPEFTPAQRNEKWLELEHKYRPWMDYANAPMFSRGAGWQRQIHIYSSPFYYIDYCLAQAVALQIFAIMQTQGHDAAWSKYMDYTILGGSKTFIELLDFAGLRNPMEKGSLDEIAAAVADYLATHASDLN